MDAITRAVIFLLKRVADLDDLLGRVSPARQLVDEIRLCQDVPCYETPRAGLARGEEATISVDELRAALVPVRNVVAACGSACGVDTLAAINVGDLRRLLQVVEGFIGGGQ